MSSTAIPLAAAPLAAAPLAAALFAAALLVPQASCQRPPQEKRRGQDPQAQHRPVPMPIPKAVIRHRGDRKITIDGALDDWPKAIPLILRDIRQVSGTALGAYRGINDLSGQLYMVWDEQFVYLALQVLDDWHHGITRKSRYATPPDNAVITFDPNRDTEGIGDDPGRREDRTFFLAEIASLKGNLLGWNLRTEEREEVKGARLFVDRKEKVGRTIYEARIPWREILPHGQLAQAGRVFDMQVVLNDYDEFTDRLAQTRIGWNFGMGIRIRPGLWGSVMLVKEFDVRDPVPKFPPPPENRHPKPPGLRYWVDLYGKILATEPKFCGADTADPALAGGAARHELLSRLESQLRAFPRLDNLAYHHRIQRRMTRETAGIAASGLPFFWDYAMRDVVRRAVPAPKPGIIRLFRLPQGGWYVRSDTVNFAINPCGLGVERLFLQGGIDFVILSRPTEIMRRHDPLLVRMSASKPKRTFFTHMSFHLPGAKPGSMSLTQPFKDYAMGGLKRIVPVGSVGEKGKVALCFGYLVEWKDGRTLFHADLGVSSTLIKKLGLAPDVVILSGMYRDETATHARAIGAKYTILEDVLLAPEYYGERLSYRDALKVQGEMKPLRSLILAPGESIDIAPK